MQWVLHGNLTNAVAEAFKRHGHAVHALSELGLPEGASLRDMVWSANKKQWDLVTNSHELINWIYEDRFPFKRSLVFLQLEGGEVEQDDAVDRLFARYKRLTPGRMYTVTGSRVKIRQLPTGGRVPKMDQGFAAEDFGGEDEE
jgi:hypothetical protein